MNLSDIIRSTTLRISPYGLSDGVYECDSVIGIRYATSGELGMALRVCPYCGTQRLDRLTYKCCTSIEIIYDGDPAYDYVDAKMLIRVVRIPNNVDHINYESRLLLETALVDDII